MLLLPYPECKDIHPILCVGLAVGIMLLVKDLMSKTTLSCSTLDLGQHVSEFAVGWLIGYSTYSSSYSLTHIVVISN